MEAKIKANTLNKQPSEVKTLILDGCSAQKFEGLTEDFTNLKSLSANFVGLTSIDGLPRLTKLKVLELSDNKLIGGLGCLAKNTPNLERLVLSNNKIANVDDLSSLGALAELKVLDLFSCGVTETDDYRQKLFDSIPSLLYLDGYDMHMTEVELSSESDEDDDEEDAGDDNDDEEDDDDDDDDDDESDSDSDSESDILEGALSGFPGAESYDNKPEGEDEDEDEDEDENEESEDEESEEEEASFGDLVGDDVADDDSADEDFEGGDDAASEDIQSDGDDEGGVLGKRKAEDL